MPPCHACPCITAPLPDISCSLCELRDEAGVFTPPVKQLCMGEMAAAVFSQGLSLSGGLNDDPHLTLDIMFTHTRTGL